MPRLQLDLIPSVACAAHFGLGAKAAPVSIDDYVAAGRPCSDSGWRRHGSGYGCSPR